MKNKYIKLLGSLIMLIVVTSVMIPVSEYIISLVLMKDLIVFSGAVVMYFLSFPLIFYSMAGSAFFFIFNRLPKYNECIVKYLSKLMFISLIIGFPISFFVGYQLKNDGYLVCEKISWMSPTTYVKDIKLCN
ncbi:DUF1240 domain-containing protein [Xenorhabdus sp. IM139775]|uniref:DUF1240 domain-containing protein n=1 Tax=Xenorhabdus sp. IM139775 TaxID=3025876 RepID=UPI002358AB88|nr:DUF1240 domain-containing protein [Xenorhabdus sp. IM139775]MDC9595086.1 DUF1240 domain-containing protein [Xenorhabdus sp. IM139775]